MKHIFYLWRFDGRYWRKIQAVEFENYPCCSRYERVLKPGERPKLDSRR